MQTKNKSKSKPLPPLQHRSPEQLVAFGVTTIRRLFRKQAQPQQGEGANAIARRLRAIQAGKVQVSKVAALLLCLLLVLPSFGCNSAQAADQLASINYEVAGYIGDALTGIRDSLKLRVLAPQRAVAAADAVQRVNLAQQKLLTELVKRLQPVDGKEQLVLTDADKSLLVESVKLLSATASEIVADPAILELDSATRTGVLVALSAIPPVAIQLIQLIQKAPTQKRLAPSLREQLQNATDKAEALRSNNDRLFAAIYAEVAR